MFTSHIPTLTHAHPHTCPPLHMHTLTCTPSQTPRVLYAVVLFDPLAADFNIDAMWLVMYNGQKRLLSGQRALQAVGTQINQKISPPDRIHIKVYISLGCPSLLFASSPIFTCPSLVFSSPPSPSFSVLHVHVPILSFEPPSPLPSPLPSPEFFLLLSCLPLPSSSSSSFPRPL